MNCPRCHGLLNRQWDTTLRIWEAHCLTCGNLPGIRLRRGDGRDLGAPKYCEVCHFRPVARIQGSAWMRVQQEKELSRCAGCRERINRKARMKARWDRKQAGRRKKKVAATLVDNKWNP